jgi:NAD(P)-dependent dehydrogenase (short-subunit alcohol dehydrogenase family)
VEGLSDSLRAEVAPFGIKVVVIEPGAIRTEWGRISADHLEAASAGTPYRDQAKAVGGVLRSTSTDRSRAASEPSVVADAIVAAVGQSRPKTRYPIGGWARTILVVNRILPDRGFDRLVSVGYRMLGRGGR